MMPRAIIPRVECGDMPLPPDCYPPWEYEAVNGQCLRRCIQFRNQWGDCDICPQGDVWDPVVGLCVPNLANPTLSPATILLNPVNPVQID
jgi:hypothetical protein